MTETYTRDSDGKKFKTIVPAFENKDGSLCGLMLIPIPEGSEASEVRAEPMPELPSDLKKQIDVIFGSEPSYHKTTMRCFAQALLKTLWEAKK